MSALAYATPAGGTGIRWQEDGASKDAETIRESVARAVAHMLTSVSAGATYTAGRESLADLEEEAGLENWDGMGARAVDPIAISVGRRFLALMPTTYPAPYIAADPDGDVSFEWEGRQGWLFSTSFSADQTIAYAGIFGPARVRGIEYFGDEIPSTIIEGLRRALAGR